uniref:DmsE family decaheme c-type cytochrome n=1 Tax=Castellaniella defragrans TaxID=75697 RepID=UPI003340E6AD
MKAKICWKTVFCSVMLAFGLASTADAADEQSTTQATQSTAQASRQQKDAVCTRCHDESETKPILSIYQTRHGVTTDPRTPACQDCHGASEAHLKGNTDGKGRPRPDKIFGRKHTDSGYKPDDAQEQADTCMNCHQTHGGKHINWKSSAHYNRDVACTSCHTVHSNHDKVRDKQEQPQVCYQCHKEQRALMNRPSHHPVPEGEMSCSSCHDVHNDNPNTLIKSSTNDTCYTCHMEKRGPFVHNHEPVQEDCALCHQPHGTSVANLLKQRAPMLCQQCHGSTSSIPGHAANTAFQQSLTTTGALPGVSSGGPVGARGCLNCHSNIHGSNSTDATNAVRFFR